MRFSFSKAPRLIIGLAIVSKASVADANFIFDLEAPDASFSLRYDVEGFALVDFAPPFEEIHVRHIGRAESSGISLGQDVLGSSGFFLSFVDRDNVQILFTIEPPDLSDSFSADVFLSNVPAVRSTGVPDRVNLGIDFNFGFVDGNVLLDTPRRLVLDVLASQHLNIPVDPDFSWSGSFKIRGTRTPEPMVTTLLASGLIALGTLRMRRKQ